MDPPCYLLLLFLLLFPGLTPGSRTGHSRQQQQQHMQLYKRDTDNNNNNNNHRALHHHGQEVEEPDLAAIRRNPDLKLISFTPDYNIHEYPPTENGHPLKVQFQINLRNVLEVDEVSQICSLETTIRMYWVDSRWGSQALIARLALSYPQSSDGRRSEQEKIFLYDHT